MRQAGLVLAVDKKRLDAAVLQARALAETGATPSDKAARRRAALARLHDVIKNNPTFREAYQALAEVHMKAGERAARRSPRVEGRPAGHPERRRRRGAARAVAVGTRAGRPSAVAVRPGGGPQHRRARSPPATPRGP